MVENIAVAERTKNLLCQDTGIPIYNVIIGRNVEFDGAGMKEAIRRGCERATKEHPLRSSVVHPITRKNEQTSCGAGVPIINVDFDERDETVEIEMIPKGSGSENGSFLQMLIPADGVAAVKRFVIDKVIECGGRVCPPTIVGVGIGGTSDLCMHLAKIAATRPLGTTCADPEGAKIEAQLERGGQRARHRPAGPRRPRDRVPRACGSRRHPHHHESGGGEHPMPFRAARQRASSRPAASPSSDAMTHHVLDMPINDAQVRALKVGDTVTLEKTLFGIRDATLIAMFDRGRTTRFDLKGHAVIHTAPNVRKVDPRPGNSVRLRAAVHRHHHVDAHGALHPAADGARRRAR